MIIIFMKVADAEILKRYPHKLSLLETWTKSFGNEMMIAADRGIWQINIDTQ